MKLTFTKRERTIIAGFLGMLHHAATNAKNKEAKKFAKKIGNKFCGEFEFVDLKNTDVNSIKSILQGAVEESTKPVPDEEMPLFNTNDLEDIKLLINKLGSV